MQIFRNAVFAAAIAGFLAGLFLAVLQSFATVPLILAAEQYELADGARSGDRPHADDTENGHHANGEVWAPVDGAERFAFTTLTSIVTGIGFGLILIAVSEIAGGIKGWRPGFAWGFAGFAVFTFAPALGLPPELPAMPAADLASRQIWWWATAISTAAGLGLMAFGRNWLIAVAGIAVMVAPHLWGAPLPENFESPVPESLHHKFVTASIMTNMIFWLALGAIAGGLRSRFQPAEIEARQTRLA